MKLIFAAAALLIPTINAEVPTTYVCLDDEKMGLGNSWVYFADNQTSIDYYAIRTIWVISYPKKIKTQLTKNNMYIFNKNPTGNCHWTKIASINNNGNLYIKNKEIENITTIASEILNDNEPTLELLLAWGIPIFAILSCLICSIHLNCSDNKKERDTQRQDHIRFIDASLQEQQARQRQREEEEEAIIEFSQLEAGYIRKDSIDTISISSNR